MAIGSQQQSLLRRDTIAGAFIALLLSFFGRQLSDERMTQVDSKRWDDELAEDMFLLSQQVVANEGEIEMQRFMGSGFDMDMVQNYLAKGALLASQNINDGTAELIDKAIANGVSMEEARKSSLSGETAQARADRLAESKAQHLQSFSSMEAAQQRGGEYTKTWIGSGLPNSRHKAISGQTVDIYMPFANGLQYPHDPSGHPDQTAGCKCSMRVNGGPTLEMLEGR